ncbi:hypothetical protein EIP86_004616 [Pleurotus ostreatoroseus]|nr:hypothetical protein EIP86_004616 [Pleurotus ostreatoroseus]
MNAIFTLLLISLGGITNALHLPVVARSPVPRHMMHNGKPAVQMQQFPFTQNIDNARDVAYATNITLGGKEFPIQLDTGSSDIWVMPPFPLQLTNTTDIPASLTFGIGEVNGTIAFANMSFGPYEVPNQAILNATVATNFDAIFSSNIFGIMGLSFDIASTVFVETATVLNNTSGLTFLTNVFQQNTSAPNLFTVLLGRSYDKDGPEEGAFTIGEYVDGFESVAQQTKLFRTPAQTVNVTTQPRWSVQMDSMTVNGKQFQFNASSVPEADPGKQVAVLDTGFTFSQLPPAAVDFIYSSIEGATFNQTTGKWTVPCECTTNLSFEFGNQSVPIHPLDITTVTTDDNDNVICTNAYQAISLPPGTAAGFDFIMGDSFLKNAYVSFDYGDFTPDNRTAGVPFVQMIATTNSTTAMDEFKLVRAHQVLKKQKSVVAQLSASSSNSAADPMAGLLQLGSSGVLSTVLHLLGLGKRSEVPMPAPSMHAVKVYHIGATVQPMRQRMAGCVKGFSAAHGAVVTTLLIGSVGLTVIAALASVIMTLWALYKRRGREDEGYQPVELKEDDVVIFDAGLP